ncbi:MAG TPA: DNA polymerase III subunit beta [Candidatus Saccharimonadia bacterium]|nr:DNA polymerase III subunit beta [Candidatus Saccharimonadia bacterium]
MRLSLTQENLSRALASVGRVVSGRSSLPVLSNVLLTTDGNRLRLSATNLEIGINYWIGSKIDEQGSLTVPARLFAEFVSSLPHGNIDLEADEANLTVRSPHYESKINGITAEEFPIIPQVTSDPALKVDGTLFREALAQVVIAASADEARPVLAGVYLYTEEGVLYMVATDSYRLAEKRLELGEGQTGELSVIVPVRTMQELVRLLAEAEGELELYLDENQIMFRVDEVELISRLIEGQFPNYRPLIPKQAATSFDIETAEFARITKVAGLFARESAGSVKLEIKAEGEVSIVSSDSEVGGNKSTAECEVSGDDGEIALNARYLQDALSVMKAPKVTFAISGKLNPCVLSPAGEGTADDYIHIVMPLRT